MSPDPPSSSLPPFSLRPVTPSDYDTLVAMRVACGWGADEIPSTLQSIADGKEAMWVFEIEGEDAGMGGIVFDAEPKLSECTSREEGRVMISRLFLYPQYHGKAYGSQMMALLEKKCWEEYAARSITLTTMNFEPYTAQSAEEAEGPYRNRLWYERRGYVEFMPPRHMYPNPPHADLIACFLEKKATAAKSDA